MTDKQHVRSTKDLVGQPVEVRVLFRALLFENQGVPKLKSLGIFC